jgi:hypothetical protein
MVYQRVCRPATDGRARRARWWWRRMRRRATNSNGRTCDVDRYSTFAEQAAFRAILSVIPPADVGPNSIQDSDNASSAHNTRDMGQLQYDIKGHQGKQGGRPGFIHVSAIKPAFGSGPNTNRSVTRPWLSFSLHLRLASILTSLLRQILQVLAGVSMI